MKKYLIIALSALFLFCSLAAAEEANAPTTTTIPAIDGYEIVAVIPDGYTMEGYEIPLGVLFTLLPEDSTRPNIVMTVTHSEEMGDITFNVDLTEEQKEQLLQLLMDDTSNPEITTGVTSHGTRLIMIHENSESDEYLAILTVWEGYIIETDIFPAEGQNDLTDEQIETAIQFISDFFIFQKSAD